MHTQKRYATCLSMSKIKDVYPKKVCHMLTRHVKKPLSKKKNNRDGSCKEVNPPCTKNIHTLAHINQGL